MQGVNHVGLAVALPLTAAAIYHSPAPADTLAWAALIVGSLAPDLDGGGLIARPSKWLPDLVPGWVDRALDRFGLAISRFIQTLLGHRGGLHWPLWGLAMAYAGQQLTWPWLFWLGIGVLLHLLGDMLTVQGIPLLGPISQRKVSIFPMRTGGRLEAAVGAAVWAVVLLFIGSWVWGLAAEWWAGVAYRLSLM